MARGVPNPYPVKWQDCSENGKEYLGWAHYENGGWIQLDPQLDDDMSLLICVHEVLHLLYPKLSEKKVSADSVKMFKTLKSIGDFKLRSS